MKMLNRITAVGLCWLGIILVTWISIAAETREWSDANGKSKIQAEFVRLKGDRVVLKRLDGKTIEVPVGLLAERDKVYLQNMLANQEPPAGAKQPAEPEEDTSATSKEETKGTGDLAAGDTTPTDTQNLVTDASAVGDSAEEFIEINYKGQTIRVPVKEGQIEIGDPKWQFSVSPLAEKPVTPQPDPSKPASVEPAPAADESRISVGTIALICVNVLVGVGVLGYFLVIEPLRRRKTLCEAIMIIQTNDRPSFDRAEELLDQALLAGLRKKDIAQARFAMGFLRCVLEKYEEASTVLGDLKNSGAEIDRSTAYMMLWVQSRLKNHERVEAMHAEYADLLQGYQQTALIASIAFLNLASMRLARREIHGAMHYFDEVRKLKVLADEIPSHLDDHEVVTGIVALFEKNKEEAEKHFEAAVDAAKQRNNPTHTGRLGLLLCKWRDESPSDIDDQLGEILTEMQPAQGDGDESASTFSTKCVECGKGYLANSSYRGKKVQCTGCRKRFLVKEVSKADSEDTNEAAEDRLLSDDDRLRRNARLWHCITRIMCWLSQEELSGLDGSEREVLRTRLTFVSDLDPDMGDPYLIDGLISYYFAKTDEERELAHKLIEKAVKLDVHVPEVLQLLDRVNKLSALSEQSLSYFHQLSGQFAENAEVDLELRQRFARNMNRFSRFQELGRIETSTGSDSIAPSLENLQGRGQILQTRVANIVHYRLGEEDTSVKEDIEKQLGELNECTQTLADGAKAFQKTEFGLMESTGEFLFHDEEPEKDGEESSDDEATESARAPQDDDNVDSDRA